MLRRLNRDESGIAMVMALLVSMVVLSLSVIVVSQSISALEGSGYDRQRFLSVEAAEAGTNWWYHHLQTTAPAALECDSAEATIESEPIETSFFAEVTYLNDDGDQVFCPFTETTYPSYATIVSTGVSGDDVPRVIETQVRLSPNRGGFSAAVLAINASSFNNRFTVYGDEGSDGDVYILNGDLDVNNLVTINGSVYVPEGSASFSNGAVVKGNLWALGDVDIQTPSRVEGGVLSSEGDITGDGTIYGDASAAGSIDGDLSVGGYRTEGADLGDVPTQTFPQITWDNAWTGYTLANGAPFTGATACTDAYNWIRSTWASGDALVKIDSTCTFRKVGGGTQTVTVRGNLAIVTKGGFDLGTNFNWNGSATVKNLYFVSRYIDPATCTSAQDISVANSTTFNSFVNVLFYTPCAATMSNLNAFTGQVLAGSPSISNNWTMNYTPVYVPSITGITGFKQDISYVREV